GPPPSAPAPNRGRDRSLLQRRDASDGWTDSCLETGRLVRTQPIASTSSRPRSTKSRVRWQNGMQNAVEPLVVTQVFAVHFLPYTLSGMMLSAPCSLALYHQCSWRSSFRI